MRWILAALAFLAATVGAPAASQATTIHIDYTATITDIFDPASLSGFSLGETITGSLTMNLDGNFYDAGNAFTDTRFFEGSGKAKVGTVGISGPNNPDPNAFANEIFHSAQDTHEEWEFEVGDNATFHSLRFFRSAIAPIIPTVGANIADLRSLLDAGLLNLDGQLASGSWSIAFAADPNSVSITTTPVPAALPLFASALGSLSLIGWRRRRA